MRGDGGSAGENGERGGWCAPPKSGRMCRAQLARRKRARGRVRDVEGRVERARRTSGNARDRLASVGRVVSARGRVGGACRRRGRGGSREKRVARDARGGENVDGGGDAHRGRGASAGAFAVRERALEHRLLLHQLFLEFQEVSLLRGGPRGAAAGSHPRRESPRSRENAFPSDESPRSARREETPMGPVRAPRDGLRRSWTRHEPQTRRSGASRGRSQRSAPQRPRAQAVARRQRACAGSAK